MAPRFSKILFPLLEISVCEKALPRARQDDFAAPRSGWPGGQMNGPHARFVRLRRIPLRGTRLRLSFGLRPCSRCPLRGHW